MKNYSKIEFANNNFVKNGKFPPESAGRAMIKEAPAVLDSATIGEIENLLLKETKNFETINYVYLVDGGEEAIGGLRNFCEAEKIKAGWFSVVGAAKEVVLSFYDLKRKKYFDKTVKKDLEIAGLSGNAAKMKEKVVIHCHGVFSDRNFRVAAGHVKKLVVSATCEIYLEKFGGRIERRRDEKTGLNLMK